ncbi:hypothetical protein GCM10007420_19330 [Glycocaulis albus]|uniref:Uncharacterized protein n=1 Tax=Glycocaulis albus TaxID=1382801 RepID=A0ABQ1XUF2_9PROT|nr:hypothetical protein [Glycocaulis albus]MBV5258842.1 hypothetical protein [Synechococcus moorigangaii CMS01]GGH03138.1 hypothetical protein GCM10007420_19330 [Glycocaulis albus]
MSVSTIMLALSLAATPASAPQRLDPDDIEALEALLRSMEAGADEQASPAEEEAGETAPPDDGEADNGEPDADSSDETDQPAGATNEDAPEEASPGSEEADEPADEGAAAQASGDDGSGSQDTTDTAAQDPEPAVETDDAADGDMPDSEAPEDPEVSNGATQTEAPADSDALAQAGSSGQDAAPVPARMTPFVGMDRYEAVRGRAFGDALALSWVVAVTPLDESGPPDADNTLADDEAAQARTFFTGDSWAGEQSGSGVWLYDFGANRILRLDVAGGSYTNTSTYAAVRRNVDIYAALSQGGQEEEIAFGPSASFHRFWLEAAMGVAAAPAGLTSTTRPAEASDGARSSGTVTSWYREEDGPAIASAWTGCDGAELSAVQHRNLITAFAHRLAIHPDILSALREGGEPVCALSFTVISPESPQGRVEHWRLEGSEPLEPGALGFADASLASANLDLVDGALRETIASALAGELGAAPSPPDFMVEIQGLQDEGDFAGAMLTLVQETAHFGLCPAETIGSERLACTGADRLAEAGAGDPGFEAVSEAIQAASEGAHRLAVEQIQPYLDREGHAGAAARTMAARQLIDWGEEGLAEYPDLDPAALLTEALAMDPFAAANYWHLAVRYMAAGAPDEAWFLMDSGRALPGREPVDPLSQAGALERRLQLLAPALFPGDAAQ